MTPRRARMLAVVLALVQGLLLAGIAWDKSDTVDEGMYLTSAASLWAHHDFRWICEAPVLPKWAFAVALRAVDPAVATTPRGWEERLHHVVAGKSGPALRRMLFTARLATVLVVVAAGLLLWSAARRFGDGPALVTLALWCFSPTVLAHGSLAALDAWSAALVGAVLWAAVRVVERPSAGRAAVLGVAAAGAAATKTTALGAVAAAAVVVLIVSMRARPAKPVALPLAFAAALVTTLWALYGFTVGGVDTITPCTRVPGATLAGMVPFPVWFEGLAFQLRHGAEGHPGYLFGATSRHGWWWFYLACLALKVTVGAQALALVRVASARAATAAERWIDVGLLAFPVLLLVTMSAARHQASISFLLPAFAPVMLWMGRGLRDVERAFGGVGRRLFLALLVVGAVEALAVYPHELMFFNLWAGGPSGGPRYLVHRDDWGQDKRRLAEWQRREGIARLYYAPYGPNAENWGIVFDPVPCEPRAGVYALHAVEVHRPEYALAPGCVDWLTIEPPDERLGYSIYIYRVDDARLARLRAARATASPFWRSGPPPAARAPAGSDTRNAGECRVLGQVASQTRREGSERGGVAKATPHKRVTEQRSMATQIDPVPSAVTRWRSRRG